MFRSISILLIGLFTPAVFAASAPDECRDQSKLLTLREHMVCMSYDMDDVFADLAKPASAAAVADHLREVRRHAQAAMAFTPSRLMALKPEQARIRNLEFQIHFAETYAAIARLEHRLLTRPVLGDTPASDPVTAQLALRLQQLIGEGHQKFR